MKGTSNGTRFHFRKLQLVTQAQLEQNVRFSTHVFKALRSIFGHEQDVEIQFIVGTI